MPNLAELVSKSKRSKEQKMAKKHLIKSILGLTLLSDLASAHQFSTTEMTLLNQNKIQTIMIDVSLPLSKSDKERLYAGGAESIVYAGDMKYFIYGDTQKLKEPLAALTKVDAINAVMPSSKVSNHLQESEGRLGAFANGAPMHFNILLLKEMDKASLERYFEKAGVYATIYNVNSALKSAKIRISPEEYEKVKNLPLVQYMDRSHTLGLNKDKIDRNLKSASYEHATALWNGAYGLHGEGISVAVVDGGLVRNTHREFVSNGVSRVFLKDNNADFADHATHVAGTITADGDDNKAHGIANQASLYSYTFLNSAFADITTSIYQRDGVLISNHSYGYSEISKLGEYDTEAAKQDRAVAANPYLNIIEAAGNDGEDSAYPAYGKIKGPGNSKNILTIGALNLNVSGAARFSSNGPVKDGRIKPDLCARGESVYSTGSSADDDYFWMSGTSMATPSVTGITVLASQAYEKVSGGYDIRHDILKACMINTAIDKGRKGPDYDTGFGMIDAKATIDTINTLASDHPLIYTNSVGHQESKEIHFTMQEAGNFKATLSWVDPEANPSSSKTLVNDLDMWLLSKSGKKYYPYTLDVDHPTALAVSTKANHVDNNEQIEIVNLPKGEYTLVIHGSEVVTDSQEFALVTNRSISQESHLTVLQPSKLHNFAKVIQSGIY